MLRFVLAVLLLATSSTALADTRLDDLLTGTNVTPAISGLQIATMKAGKPGAGYALGFAQRDGESKTTLTRDHKVRVASISKLVVAVGVMQLVERGALDLDQDVSNYLGWPLRNPLFPNTPITARQLLAHTSSVRDGPRYFIAAGEGELRDFFDPSSQYWDDGQHYSDGAVEAPGEFFVYANLNFGLLGELLERISGQRFDQYMAEHVLIPLGIAARFDPCAIQEELLAAAFRKRVPGEAWDPEGPWVAQVDAGTPRCFYGAEDEQSAKAFLNDYIPGSNASLFSPQGGLRASADDLLAVMRMLANKGMAGETRVLTAASVEEMLKPEWTLDRARNNGLSAGEAEPGGATDGLMTSYGLSVHRIDLRAWGFDKGPALLVGHLGEAYGLLSQALFDPETGDGLVAIITGTGDDPGKSPGHSPLYRVEEEVLRWWVAQHP